MFNLAVRNLKIFFRQKSTVFFSLLGVFVIIGLYVLFLVNQIVQSIYNILHHQPACYYLELI